MSDDPAENSDGGDGDLEDKEEDDEEENDNEDDENGDDGDGDCRVRGLLKRPRFAGAA